MLRRDFVKSALLVGGSSLLRPKGRGSLLRESGTQIVPDPEVKRVLAMFKCHFDAGFIDTQAKVVHRYFSEFFPQAIRVAAEMRQRGEHRYVWTTGSWLLYEYLEQATSEDRKQMRSEERRVGKECRYRGAGW